jgi:hypothetical protein
MKRCFLVIFISVIQIQCYSQSHQKKRSESFFGVHFDFHATNNDCNIGKTLNVEMVDSFLSSVKPDYIQIDTKGHEGISSYPTAVGSPAPGIVKDPIKIFREASSKNGVGLYCHFSGVMDAEAIRKHPNWARINADGRSDPKATSLFSDYCDKYFVPQIEELSKKYKIDGVWIDGECWAVQPDFSTSAQKAYLEATGQKAALNTSYMDFTRRSFDRYLTRYVNILHAFDPKLQIASNWAYSSYMPGKVNAKVDFLSGDIVDDRLINVEFESRVMASQNKPWDLMIWGFMGDKNGQGHFWKSAKMLQQKVSAIIAQGGGYSIYINQNRDASIPIITIPNLTQVAKFGNARKAYAFRSTATPQIGMLLSASGHNYDLGLTTAFNQNNGGNDNIKGTMSMLLNSGYSVQIFQDHISKGSLNTYSLVVITEWNHLEKELISKIKEYVNSGGKLLLIGSVTCSLFDQILPASLPEDRNNKSSVPVKINRYGKGTVAGINANISLAYFNCPNDDVRETVSNLTQKLFPNPIATVNNSKAHISLARSNGSSYIHVLNANDKFTIGNNDQLIYQLRPLKQITLTYRTMQKPKQVLIQPGALKLNYTYKNGIVKFILPELVTYSIIQLK